MVTDEQLGPSGFEYNRFRELMTAKANAAIAGHFGVPVAVISGDDAIVTEARRIIGDLEGRGREVGHRLPPGQTLVPQAAYDLSRDQVRTALGRLEDFEPYRLETPITLDVRFKNYRPSELLAFLSIVERTDSHSIRFVGEDMVEVSKFWSSSSITTAIPHHDPGRL